MTNFAIVTFAIGKKYQEYAIALAASFQIFNGKNDIHLYIISNKIFALPKHFSSKIHVIEIKRLRMEKEILLNKIFASDYIDVESFFLVDADSFICSNLIPLFHKYRNSDIVIWGEKLTAKDKWRGNLPQLLDENGLNYLYRINGGLYYFTKSICNSTFFNLCKELVINYDELTLPKVYNELKDDEIIFSLACAKLGIEIKDYDSTVKAETMYYPRRDINLIVGKCKLYYNNYEITHSNILLQRTANPLIICFDRDSINDFDYKLNAKYVQYFIKNNFVTKILIALYVTLQLSIYYFVLHLKKSLSNLKHSNINK